MEEKNENIRTIVRKIEDFDKFFNDKKLKINLFLSRIANINLLDDLIVKKSSDDNSLFVFFKH